MTEPEPAATAETAAQASAEIGDDAGTWGPIVDRHGRTFDYLRVALTERCNLRCVYCMPAEGVDFRGGNQILSTPEFLRVIGVAARLGVRKIRFTGGEPLVRKKIMELVSGAAQTPGVESVHLTSNGVLLADRLDELVQAAAVGRWWGGAPATASTSAWTRCAPTASSRSPAARVWTRCSPACAPPPRCCRA